MSELYSRWAHHAFIELADPRTTSWPLMQTPWRILSIIGLYLMFVMYLGPRLMKNRKPFKLQKILVFYNAIQVLISLSLVWPGLYLYASGTYSLSCQPVDRSRNAVAMKVARAFYWYHLAKLTELLDTIFFVLRKKDNQVSFLHVVHHSGMSLLTWCGVKYFPGGHLLFGGFINSIVHVIMYTYYMIAAMGPKYQKYLWWKKYITKIQLIQFVLGVVHFSQIFIFDCGFPKWIAAVILPNGFFMFDMFSDFYKKAYITRKEAEQKALLMKDQQIREIETDNDKQKVH
ncbi:very long chain fatty acid elongase AAEL008004-like [Culicoides brevitarsis]|uniref:very long chain fatty acid elongase AAEL008004-like n=1 Tax=Culicoides brevitarsis TaxID=469753 RepID=UPI00307C0094